MLITQVFRHLSQNWRVNTGLNAVPFTSLSWGTVKDKLQMEDNIRRQSNTTAEDATMPLGWTKGHARAKTANAGENPEAPPAMGRGAFKAEGEYHGKRPENYQQGGARQPAKVKGLGPSVVCYHCKKSGHVWHVCRTKPDGWEPSAQDVSEAERMRGIRLDQSGKAKQVNASRGEPATQPASSTPKRSVSFDIKGTGSASAAAGSSAPRASASASSNPKVGKVSLPQV
jgi:hypothetical protein